jgi:hypothetical protein
MDSIFVVLIIIITSGGVFASSFFILKAFFKNEHRLRAFELKKANQSISLPIRLQAYERIIIFLERIQPNSLILRVNRGGMSSQQLQMELIHNIKSEFEHNLSQQIYVSFEAWELVKIAKEETIKMINIASSKVYENSKSQELAVLILQLTGEVDKLPGQIAINYIKQEISKIY